MVILNFDVYEQGRRFKTVNATNGEPWYRRYANDFQLNKRYSLMWYGEFYAMQSEIRCVSKPEHVYTLCGTDKDGKILCVVTNYSDDDDAAAKIINVDFGRKG